MKRGVVLGTQTRLDLLNEADRRRHEKILEKLATRMALASKPTAVVKALGKDAARLLKS